jgi:hypothetical protein
MYLMPVAEELFGDLFVKSNRRVKPVFASLGQIFALC